MAKKATNTQPPQNEEDAAVEQRVKEMMDPTMQEPSPKPDPKPKRTPIEGLPVPKEPLKIKILHDGEEPTFDEGPTTAPELKGAPEVKEPVAEPPREPEEPEKPVEQSAPPDPKKKPADEAEPPEDPVTANAVDDIVRHESDEVLAAEDAKRGSATDVTKNKPKKKHPGRGKKLLKLFLLAVFLGVAAAAIIPTSRYYVLNAAGVRATSSIHILDQSTQQPLKGVKVSAAGVESVTDENGDATLEGLELGPTKLRMEKIAFAVVERNVTIGWGSNPMGEEKMEPTGVQYAFEITDYLSGKPIVKAEAVSGLANAFSDKKGELLLTIDEPDEKLEVTISAPGYRPEKFTMATEKPENKKVVKMVPARKHAYVSDRDGRYDVYAAYADGKGEKLIIKGTGNETADIAIAQHPTDEVLAIVSTRDGKKGDNGQLLQNLTVVNIRTKKAKVVQTAERVQLVGWMGERLIYVREVADAKNSDPNRNRLIAYHYKDETNNELAAANYFNDIITAGNRIYFAPAAAFQEPNTAKLYSFSPDGTDRKTLLDKEIWDMFHSSYDHIVMKTADDVWYEYGIGNAHATKLAGEPADPKSYLFVDSPDGHKSFWIEKRDGKNVLLVHDVKSGEERTIATKQTPSLPAGWLNNDTIVFRVSKTGETADYAVSLNGGEPKKIKDVAETESLDSWYYY